MKLLNLLCLVGTLLLFSIFQTTIFAQSDDPCGAPVLPVGPSCTTASGTNATATASPGVPAPGCANYSGGDVWYQIVVPAGGAVTIETFSGVITDGGLAVYSGTCGALSLVQCNDDGGTGLMSLIALTGQTPGSSLWVRVWEFGNDNNGTFSICATAPFVPSAPANDNCSGAIPLTPGASCSFTATTNAGATASAGVPAPGCASYSGGDVWYSVVVPAAGNITVETGAATITDGGLAIYSGTCGALTLIQCDDDGGTGLMSLITLTGQTPGATLYIRVWEFGNDNNGSFNICATIPPPPPPPPANDNCSGAFPVNLNTDGTCNLTTAGTLVGGTGSPQSTIDCSGTENDDVWFSFVAPTSGAVNLNMLNVSGTPTDIEHSVWQGTCPALTLFAGSCSDPNSSSLTGLTPGLTYFVRVYSYFASTGQTTTFDVCIQESDICGGGPTNDWCQAPAILSPGVGTFSSNTSGTYSSDTPANLNSVFCGSVENNSWYEFVATAATATFNFNSVTGCLSGIQAEVYSITNDVNGCCTNFTSVSNCWNPGIATTGIVTATGLTIGNTYTLMVDGFGGDVCDFQVANWTAIGILPVELVNFFGVPMPQENRLTWQTASELNNNRFIISRSFDATHFEEIGQVEGIGNSTVLQAYEFIDQDVRTGTMYYQLTQVDIDGTSVQSELITLQRSSAETGLLGIYPNPAKDRLYVEVNATNEPKASILRLRNAQGKEIESKVITQNGFGIMSFEMHDLASGIYFVHYESATGNSIIKRIIKQ